MYKCRRTAGSLSVDFDKIRKRDFCQDNNAYNLSVTSNNLDDDFIDMGTQRCFLPCEDLSNLLARRIFSDLSDSSDVPRFYIL